MEKIVAVLIASDSRSDGRREDLTGPAAIEALAEIGLGVIEVAVVPDEIDPLMSKMMEWADQDETALILTCGGTGLSPRDVTPEATIQILEKAVPGIPQLIRAKSMEITPYGALSRGVAGIRNNTLIINLPGSPKAVKETIKFMEPILHHALETVAGRTVECAR